MITLYCALLLQPLRLCRPLWFTKGDITNYTKIVSQKSTIEHSASVSEFNPHYVTATLAQDHLPSLNFTRTQTDRKRESETVSNLNVLLNTSIRYCNITIQLQIYSGFWSSHMFFISLGKNVNGDRGCGVASMLKWRIKVHTEIVDNLKCLRVYLHNNVLTKKFKLMHLSIHLHNNCVLKVLKNRIGK